jgi:small-conductance mechanosensitive channel
VLCSGVIVGSIDRLSVYFILSYYILLSDSGLNMLLSYFVIFVAGIATAIAARDILGNMLTGLLMQFSQPFSIGDTIKVYHC